MGRQGKTEANPAKKARAGAYQAEQQLPSGRIYPDLPRSVGSNMGEYQRRWQSSPSFPGHTSEDAMLGHSDPHRTSYSSAPRYNQYANTLAGDKVHRLPPAHTHEFRRLCFCQGTYRQ